MVRQRDRKLAAQRLVRQHGSQGPETQGTRSRTHELERTQVGAALIPGHRVSL